MGLLGEDIDPKTQGLLALGFGLLNSRGNLGQAIGQAGPQAMQAYSQANDAIQRKKQQEQAMQAQALQMQMSQQQMAELQRQAQERDQQNARDDAFRSQLPADPQQMLLHQALMNRQIKPMEYFAAIRKDTTPIKLGKDDRLLEPGTNRVLVDAMPDPAKMPAAIQEYEYAKQQGYGGTFQQFVTDLKKAGATNIGMPKIEVKMGESVAGQIGPMAKDSRIQAQGAVGMFDSAERIQKALDSGKASSGPLTTQIQTVKQLVQKISGGNDEGIRQTRQVIRGLAQMSVEARKELQGQGQVTESEAAAVAKAESGDINDLSTGELQDLVTLTKRAAHMRAKSHQTIIDSMAGSDATRGMVPFYQVNNIDKLLKHSPQLPQIGAGNAVDDLVKKYGGK